MCTFSNQMPRQKIVNRNDYDYAVNNRKKGSGGSFSGQKSNRLRDPNYYESAFSAYWRPEEDLVDVYNQVQKSSGRTAYWAQGDDRIVMISTEGRDSGRTRGGSTVQERMMINFAKDVDLNPGKYAQFGKKLAALKVEIAAKLAKEGLPPMSDTEWQTYSTWITKAYQDNKLDEARMVQEGATGQTIADIESAALPTELQTEADQAKNDAINEQLRLSKEAQEAAEAAQKEKERKIKFQLTPELLAVRKVQGPQSTYAANTMSNNRPRGQYDRGMVRYLGASPAQPPKQQQVVSPQ